jgi:hypothetical protein
VELLRPACGIVVGTNLPPDVRLAGKSAVKGLRLGSLRSLADPRSAVAPFR